MFDRILLHRFERSKMVREYIFPDPKDQERKEYIKDALKICKNAEERKIVFFTFFGDPSYRAPVLHQALKECELNDDFTFKSITCEHCGKDRPANLDLQCTHCGQYGSCCSP